jgi:monoamine oxidase
MTVRCKKVIISIPTTLYPSIEFSPQLPPAKHRLSESTVLGYYAKMIFVFEKPWWRDAGFSGSFSSAEGPTSFSRDTCLEEDNQYSITCFLVGDKGRRWSKFSKSARRQQVQDQFYTIFGAAVKDIPEPINIIEKEWMKDPWARGAPCPVMPPGVMTSDAGQAIRDVFGDLHFVGTETALVWKGYMEGAVRSGVRGATEVIKALWKSKPIL